MGLVRHFCEGCVAPKWGAWRWETRLPPGPEPEGCRGLLSSGDTAGEGGGASPVIDPRGTNPRGAQRAIERVAQANERQVSPALRLQVAVVEALKQHEGDEEGQHEIEDGRGIVLEAVIQGPMGDEGVEEIVLDVPAAVTGPPETATSLPLTLALR